MFLSRLLNKKSNSPIVKCLAIFFFVFFYFMIIPCAYSASPILSGYIVDNQKEALPHASIMVKNSTLSATADEKGYFQLLLPKEGHYHIRVILSGYEMYEQEVFIQKDTLLHVSLKNGALNLSEVTITSTRTPKLLKEVPVLTRVITSDDIKKLNASTVQDLLEMELPGLEFTRQMDGQTVINMQGMGGNYLLFLIDGERLSGETLNNVDYNRLNVDNIERIEIVKGAASTLYGSSAIGGVINIITKNVKDPWQVSVSGRYGRLHDQRYCLSAGFKVKDFSSLTSVTYKSIQTDTLYDTASGDESARATFVYGGRDITIDEKLTWQPIKRLRMIAKGGYYFRDRFNHAKRPDRYQGYNAGFQAFYHITDKHQLHASYAFDQYNKYIHYLVAERDDSLTYSNRQHTGRLQYDYFINKKQTLSAGAELFNDRLMTYQFEGGQHTTNTYVLFAQHDWNIFKGFTAVYGARLDYHSEFGVHVSPKVSLMYNIKAFTFRTSYGHGFRSPSLKELYMDWDHQGMFRIVGNTKLTPEKSDNISLSGEYSHKRVNVSVMGFYNNIRDKITNMWMSVVQDTAMYINVNQSVIFGSEVSVSTKLPLGFGIRASYSYVNDKQMEDGVNISDTRPHSATLRFMYDLTKKRYGLNVTLGGRFLGPLDMVAVSYASDDPEQENPIFESLHYPGYMMWKLVITQRFCNSFSLTVGADNLFNYKPKTYTYNTTLSPGITLFVGLAIDINQAVKKKNYVKR